MIRVLIVDDSAFVRQALSRMLTSDPGIEIAGTAVDGKDAAVTGFLKALGFTPSPIQALEIRLTPAAGARR